MAEIDTLGIIEEIRSFVSDRLQVISYKWLSRNFSVSSNAAKRLLEEFVEKYGDGLVVIYSLSGWLKCNPTTYHIRLVPKHMLSDAKQEFDGNCSVHIYSIQACLPKDPATLWNHEFVQAEDLFKQPPAVDNCLRDNRFCRVSNSFVKRTGGGTPSGSGSLLVKSEGVSGLSSSSFIPPATAAPKSVQRSVQNAGSRAGVQSPSILKPVKTEGNVKPDLTRVAEKEKVTRPLPNNKNGQNDKNSSGSGGALASMLGRASAKPKPDASLVEAEKARQNASVSAEAQISARESAKYESSDDDDDDDDDDDKAFSVRRTSNGEGSRKRRVVLNYSDDEDENAISLGSPDPLKKSCQYSKDSSKASVSECNLSFLEKEDKPKVKEEKESDVKADQHLEKKVTTVTNGKKAESPTSEKTLCHVPETDASKKNTMADDLPKKKKVVTTRIDERGREVTVVVWEGEEQETKPDTNSAKIAWNKPVSNAVNRPHVVRKSPAMGNTAPAIQAGKAGNKKAAIKDPKQGNLFSFFKKA